MTKPDKEKCQVCKKKVRVMIYRGTGVCSQICKRKRDGDLHKPYGTGAVSAS